MTRIATFRARGGRGAQLVAVSGSGRIKVDDELFELRPRDAVRVAPASTREPEAGPGGREVLAFGSHSPGDGEMVADWWTM